VKPAAVDLPIIWRGCNYGDVILAWKNPDGSQFDLTGWTPKASTRNFDFTIAMPSPGSGFTRIRLSKAITAGLRLGREAWDWIWTDPNGVIYPPILAGYVAIKEPVTDPTTDASPL